MPPSPLVASHVDSDWLGGCCSTVDATRISGYGLGQRRPVPVPLAVAMGRCLACEHCSRALFASTVREHGSA